ncbi:hypothetical protein [Streptomyces sp. VNUA24]|uniref:hypothetical protein n=1 Tax=Streptomyces sp. VNUA24 TaxID=3031131 RepID=UPI0023B7C64B|nr:hypothetical protein [Streptomyces sp. VNUA24]WEH15611.1 hypothetical protein PYR72_18550 [Streptomyces sp. VNUA24]
MARHPRRLVQGVKPFLHDLVESYRAFSPDGSTPDTEQVRVHTHVILTPTE